jgi:Na+-transporting NADH:ubiquinone oxidoreductase subunit C
MFNTLRSILFALLTAVVCSFLLTAASAGLKPFQAENVEVDQKKNILKAVGWIQEDKKYSHDMIKKGYAASIQEVRISPDGVIVDEGESPEKILPVYVYMKNGQIASYIIPINSRGLWGKIMGYLALRNDGSTIAGFTVYKHNETPGLGGEIEKRWFQKNFEGKKILDRDGSFVSISIAKGALSPSFPEDKRPNYVDGISGATLTGKYLTAGLKDTLLDYEPVSVKFRTKQMMKITGSEPQR